MQFLTRAISAIAMTAYLAAAFLPCEPIGKFDGEVASRPLNRFAPPAAAPAPRASSAHAHSVPHDHGPAYGHEDGPAPAAHEHGRKRVNSEEHAHHAHGDEHDHRRGEERVVAARGAADPNAAGFRAPCLCGCGDTRSTVGGGTARLGSVVPGVWIARLPEAAGESRHAQFALHFANRTAATDWIPI